MELGTSADPRVAAISRLYSQDGYSAREVAHYLRIGLHSVYRLMRKHNIPRRDFETINRLRFAQKPLSYTLRRELSPELHRLKIAGVMLYWGEGAKRGHTVDFANSDVEACKVFLRFLREVCGIEESRLRAFLYCHSDQDTKQLIKFWSEELSLSKKQFTKPYIRSQHASRGAVKRSARMEYGLLHIRYSDLKLLRQIREWMNEYIKSLIP